MSLYNEKLADKDIYMLSRDIVTYAKVRYELRAYMVYLFTQNIKNFMPNPTLESVLEGLTRIKDEIKVFDSMYILDKNGTQISDVLQPNSLLLMSVKISLIVHIFMKLLRRDVVLLQIHIHPT